MNGACSCPNINYFFAQKCLVTGRWLCLLQPCPNLWSSSAKLRDGHRMAFGGISCPGTVSLLPVSGAVLAALLCCSRPVLQRALEKEVRACFCCPGLRGLKAAHICLMLRPNSPFFFKNLFVSCHDASHSLPLALRKAAE